MLIFTDASFSSKPKMAGLGFVIIHEGAVLKVGTYEDRCRDNNVAEIAAIASALKYVENRACLEEHWKDEPITIISDSDCALGRITHEHPGSDDFERQCLSDIYRFMTRRKVTYFQIKAHQRDGSKLSYYNCLADSLAGEYRQIGLELYYTNNRIKNKKAIRFLQKRGGRERE